MMVFESPSCWFLPSEKGAITLIHCGARVQSTDYLRVYLRQRQRQTAEKQQLVEIDAFPSLLMCTRVQAPWRFQTLCSIYKVRLKHRFSWLFAVLFSWKFSNFDDGTASIPESIFLFRRCLHLFGPCWVEHYLLEVVSAFDRCVRFLSTNPLVRWVKLSS